MNNGMNNEPQGNVAENMNVQQPQPRLSKKEIYALKQSKYNEKVDSFENSYVIMNKKTGMIVEMKASSPMHACTMIGWRVKNCKLMDTIVKKTPEKVEAEIVEIIEKK